MMGDIGGVDVAGNPYGVDLSVDTFGTFDTFDGFCDAGSNFEMGFDPGAGFGNDWSD